MKHLPRYLFLFGDTVEARYDLCTKLLDSCPADHVRTRLDLLTSLRTAMVALFHPDDPLIDLTKHTEQLCFCNLTHGTIQSNLALHFREYFGPAALGELLLHNHSTSAEREIFDGFIVPDLATPVDALPFIREYGPENVGISTLSGANPTWAEKYGPPPRFITGQLAPEITLPLTA